MSQKLTINVLQEYAKNKGGLLVSVEYINSKTKLVWQCKEGHQWEATSGIKNRNSWCMLCSGKSKKTLEELQDYAITKGGLLLSTKYENGNCKLLWQCKEKHNFSTSWNSVQNMKSWCPICSDKAKPDICLLINKAKEHGGELVSPCYINAKQKLTWKCKFGHLWDTRWNDVKIGHWCPTCSNCAKYTVTELQKYAITKGGLLLSTEYINNKLKLLWQCKEGHQWKAAWQDINTDHWCPECSSFKTERLVRLLLESKFNISLNKTRFIYNKNKYEFDGYNEEHKIAFEYHGYQHFIYPNFFHKTEELFNKAVQRDRDKEQYCLENNIRLIIVPYTEEKTLEEFISNLS